MKKTRGVLLFFLIYFAIYFLQVNFFSWFNINGVKPNLFVVLVLLIGLYTNSKIGQVLGFIIGLLTDFLFSNSIGVSAVLFMFIGYVSEPLQNRFPKNSKITLMIMSTIITVVYELIKACYRYMFFSSQIGFVEFTYTLLIELIFNVLLIIILYPAINKFSLFVDDTFNGKDSLTKYF